MYSHAFALANERLGYFLLNIFDTDWKDYSRAFITAVKGHFLEMFFQGSYGEAFQKRAEREYG